MSAITYCSVCCLALIVFLVITFVVLPLTAPEKEHKDEGFYENE